MVTTDVWMTWAARADELPLPSGMSRRQAPRRGMAEARELIDESFSNASREREADHIGLAWPEAMDEVADQLKGAVMGDAPADPTIGLRSSSTADATTDVGTDRAVASSRRRRFQPAGRVLAFLAAGGVAACGMVAAPGCETLVPIAVHATVTACIEMIKSLFDAPADQLPEGYIPCNNFVWPIQGHELKFCLFCNPAVPNEAYVQFQCEGKYYPLRLRRIERPAAASTEERLSIESIKCHERFLLEIESTIAPFMSGATCAMRSPNQRVLPSVAHYGTLDVRIDGAPAPRDGDFTVEAGSRIELDGSFDEVAHYAMICGVDELTFKDSQGLWNVHANPDVSAIAIFRNGTLHDARFLFAPMPPEGLGD
jgi:hypothetical protein